MIFDIDIAKQLAKSLLQINAIILQPNKPFTWASGWRSPIYCDNRKTLSFPELRTFIRQNICKVISDIYGGSNIIAGVATGGIPHGVLAAEELGIPFIYVRTKIKEHGRMNQIEGYYDEGQSVIVVEDLISTGKSSLSAVKALKEKKLNIKGMVSIFDYGFKISKENFKKLNCDLFSLCNYDIVIEEALKKNYINNKEKDVLISWKNNPSNW